MNPAKVKNSSKSTKTKTIKQIAKQSTHEVAPRLASARPRSPQSSRVRSSVKHSPVTEIATSGVPVTRFNGVTLATGKRTTEVSEKVAALAAAQSALAALEQGAALTVSTGDNSLTLSPGAGDLIRAALKAMLQAPDETVFLRVSRGEELLSPEAVAKELGVSRPHVYKMLDRGDLPYEQVGKHRRVPSSAVFGFLRAQDEHVAQVEEMAAEARRLADAEGEIPSIDLATAIRKARASGDLNAAKTAHRAYQTADLARSLRRQAPRDDLR